MGSAKNEYIRVLKKDKITNEIKILNNLKAHGRYKFCTF